MIYLQAVTQTNNSFSIPKTPIMCNKTTLSLSRQLLCMIAAILSLTFYTTAQAAIIYVNSVAVGANTGATWANAFTNLQAALTISAAGDQIWVAKGVYQPSLPVDINGNGLAETREATFQIKSGVKIYGGFAGGEATLAERNWVINLTILSGDIDGNDLNADANHIAENTDQLVGNNAYHVVYTVNVDANTLLDGFIITAGRANAEALPSTSPNVNGGGWFNRLGVLNTSSPGIANCTFQGNFAASSGGAWYGLPGSTGAVSEPQFAGCRFISNKAGLEGGAIFIGSFQNGLYKPVISNGVFTGNRALRRGGAVYLLGDAAEFYNTTFTDNAVTVISGDGSTLPGSGGAVNMVASEAHFSHCMFIGNKATGNPTGAYEGGGGGAVYMVSVESLTINLGEANIRFQNCGFYNNIASDNTAAWGGAAVHLNDTGRLLANYINCVFSGNQAQTDGGAIASYSRQLSTGLPFTPVLQTNYTNCTFSNNSAGASGGGLYFNMATNIIAVLTAGINNSIIYGNTAPSLPQIRNSGTGFSGPVIAYSLLQGGYTAASGVNGGNNIGANPLFINAADPDGTDNIPGTPDDGLRVGNGSPAINAGNSAAAGLAGVTIDFAGAARIQGASVDMGAYERASIGIPPFVKYFRLKEWRRPQPGCLSCPWAIRLQDKAIILAHPRQGKGVLQNFEWKSRAQLAVYADSAVVRGRIASRQNPSIQFEVYLKLIKPGNWAEWSAQNRSYSALTPEAKKVADQNFQQWTYWVLSEESRLTGRAAIAGSLKLTHAPANLMTGFQLGLGANDQDGDFGLNGEFFYAGVLSYRRNKQAVSGVGSLNADAFSCEKDCLNEQDENPIARHDFAEPAQKQPYLVYPNPVHDKLSVKLADAQEGPCIVTLYDLKGQKVQQVSTQTGKLHVHLDVNHITPGIYLLEIQSPDGSLQYSKIVCY
jgi:predicted outer membrane repeat protein